MPEKCRIHTFTIDSTLHHLALEGEEGADEMWAGWGDDAGWGRSPVLNNIWSAALLFFSQSLHTELDFHLIFSSSTSRRALDSPPFHPSLRPLIHSLLLHAITSIITTAPCWASYTRPSSPLLRLLRGKHEGKKGGSGKRWLDEDRDGEGEEHERRDGDVVRGREMWSCREGGVPQLWLTRLSGGTTAVPLAEMSGDHRDTWTRGVFEC